MSKYMLRHDEASCIGCLACEVHCKTNKDLGPGPDPCKIVSIGPVDVDGHAADAVRLHALLPLRGPLVREGLSDRRDAEAREGRHRLRRLQPLHRLQELHRGLPLGHVPQWDPATSKVVKCDYCMDRIDAGLQPACVTKCVTGCLSFGVANEVPDPRRERYARQLLAEPLER